MRTIINISLPKEMAKKVGKEVESGKFATKSEFFRALLRMWEENKLRGELKQSQREISEGKGRVLRSLKDLR